MSDFFYKGSDGAYIHFLIIVEQKVATSAGSVSGLDLLSKNPDEYWTPSRWGRLLPDDVVWMAQVCRIPAKFRVSTCWNSVHPRAKTRILAKSRAMAKRAVEKLIEDNANLKFGSVA